MSAEVEGLSEVETLDLGVPTVDIKIMPEVIQGQVAKLENLGASVNKAKQSAETAKAAADKAKSISVGWFNKKAAIDELQSAGVALAEAAQFAAEAQKISFEFQTKLAEITKYLFGLGVSSIAANRFVVRELELRLKGASQVELSELARQELQLVLKQLKDQQDVLIKQENFANIVKDHDGRLSERERNAQELDEKVKALESSIQNQIKAIKSVEDKQGALGGQLGEISEANSLLKKALDVNSTVTQGVRADLESEKLFSIGVDQKLETISKQFEQYQSNVTLKFARLHLILGTSLALTIGLVGFILFRM